MSIADKLAAIAQNEQRIKELVEQGGGTGSSGGVLRGYFDITKNADYFFSYGLTNNDVYTMSFLSKIFTDYDDTISVTSMKNMFQNHKPSGSGGYIFKARLFNTINVTNMYGMFQGCEWMTSFLGLDTRNATNMGSMFSGCSRLTTVEDINTSKATNFAQMFYSCAQLSTIPDIDISNATSINSIFASCSSLKRNPLVDNGNVSKTMTFIFQGSGLETIELNAINATNLQSAFSGCSKLTSAFITTADKLTNVNNMFRNCSKLVTTSYINTTNVTDVSTMYYGCSVLKTIPELDIRNVSSSSYVKDIFYNCTNLTDINIKNIKVPLTIGSGTSYGHLLTTDSLIRTIYELIDTGSTKKLTMGSANLEKLANVYVKLIDVTSEMRAEDQLVDSKLPFVQCESTDAGAQLITSYVTLKNWSLV